MNNVKPSYKAREEKRLAAYNRKKQQREDYLKHLSLLISKAQTNE